jgi:septal ring factor EnvC (AmiA/AmiB activator)
VQRQASPADVVSLSVTRLLPLAVVDLDGEKTQAVARLQTSEAELQKVKIAAQRLSKQRQGLEAALGELGEENQTLRKQMSEKQGR